MKVEKLKLNLPPGYYISMSEDCHIISLNRKYRKGGDERDEAIMLFSQSESEIDLKKRIEKEAREHSKRRQK